MNYAVGLVFLLGLSNLGFAQKPQMPEIQTIQAGDLRVAYHEEGEGPLVVLVHGFPDTPYTWVDVRPALAEAGFRVVTPYLRGYSPTEIPDDIEAITSERLGQDILNFVDALGDEPVYLVGHDWGAAAAYAAATLGPERIEKLVTIAIPHPESIDLNLRQVWAGRHFIYLGGKKGVKKMQKNDLAHVDALYERWAPDWQAPEWQISAIKEIFADERALDAAVGYYRGSRIESDLFKTPIDVNTLAVCGSDDILNEVHFEGGGVHFSQPYSYKCVPGGHWPHRESPEAFNRVLIDFLKAEQ